MSSSRTTLAKIGGTYSYYKLIAEELHGFAKTEDKVMITAAQLNRCLAKGTLIGNIKIENINIGDKIKGSSNKVEVLSKIKTKQKCYKIKLKSGKEIVVSANHRFPTKYGLCSIESGLVKGMELSSK